MLKQGQADCVIRMYEKATKWNFERRPAWAVKLQEEMFQKCKELNKTGDEDEDEEPELEAEPEHNSQCTFGNWSAELNCKIQ